MSLYESVLIARNGVTRQQVEDIVDSIASQLEIEGGAMKKWEYWGLRRLAYRIKKNRKGHYMLLGLDAKPAFVSEMERQLRLNEDILRFMTLRVDDIEEGPSAVLTRKPDEGDRNFRGRKPWGRFDSGRRRSFGDQEDFAPAKPQTKTCPWMQRRKTGQGLQNRVMLIHRTTNPGCAWDGATTKSSRVGEVRQHQAKELIWEIVHGHRPNRPIETSNNSFRSME